MDRLTQIVECRSISNKGLKGVTFRYDPTQPTGCAATLPSELRALIISLKLATSAEISPEEIKSMEITIAIKMHQTRQVARKVHSGWTPYLLYWIFVIQRMLDRIRKTYDVRIASQMCGKLMLAKFIIRNCSHHQEFRNSWQQQYRCVTSVNSSDAQEATLLRTRSSDISHMDCYVHDKPRMVEEVLNSRIMNKWTGFVEGPVKVHKTRMVE